MSARSISPFDYNLLELYRRHRDEIDTTTDPTALFILAFANQVDRVDIDTLAKEVGLSLVTFRTKITPLLRGQFMVDNHGILGVTAAGKRLLTDLGFIVPPPVGPSESPKKPEPPSQPKLVRRQVPQTIKPTTTTSGWPWGVVGFLTTSLVVIVAAIVAAIILWQRPTLLPSPTPPIRIAFSADRTNLMLGECTTLRWQVQGSDWVEINGQRVNISDASQVCPQQTTTYTLIVGGREDVSQKVEINVVPPTTTGALVATNTPTSTPTGTRPPTPSPTVTNTPTPTPTGTRPPTPTNTFTPTPTRTFTPIIGTISGRVLVGRQVVSGATVQLSRQTVVSSATTDNNGYYALNNIIAGQYFIQAQSQFGKSQGAYVNLWTNNTTADLTIVTPVDTRYAALGASGGILGTATREVVIAPDGVGLFQDYQNGHIYWHPQTDAYLIRGAIFDKWAQLNWEKGILGYPTTDELTTPDGVGRYNHFQGGSIYWTPQTGAHEVRGAIRDKWASLDWEKGILGYPTSDEQIASDGRHYNTFQKGCIYLTQGTAYYGTISDPDYSKGFCGTVH